MIVCVGKNCVLILCMVREIAVGTLGTCSHQDQAIKSVRFLTTLGAPTRTPQAFPKKNLPATDQVGLSAAQAFWLGLISKLIASTICYPLTRIKQMCQAQTKRSKLRRSSSEETEGKALSIWEMSLKVWTEADRGGGVVGNMQSHSKSTGFGMSRLNTLGAFACPFFLGQNLEDLNHNRCDHETWLNIEPVNIPFPVDPFHALGKCQGFFYVSHHFQPPLEMKNPQLMLKQDTYQALFMFGIFTKATRTIAFGASTRTIAFGTSHPNKESLRSKFSQFLGCSTVANLASRNKMDILWHFGHFQSEKQRKTMKNPAGWWFGTMEFYDFPHLGNEKSSRLTFTNSIIFRRAWWLSQPPTSQDFRIFTKPAPDRAITLW